jgi:[ribosomal protein S5]-alanine N-acetyltransferase
MGMKVRSLTGNCGFYYEVHRKYFVYKLYLPQRAQLLFPFTRLTKIIVFMQPIIETERLLIREMLDEDQHDMFEMDSDEEVHRYLGNKALTSLDQVKEYIQLIRQQYANYGIARWTVVKKDTNEAIGWMGFKYMEGPINSHSNYYDFGYRFKSKHWRQGYATESGVAALKHGLEVLKLKPVFAMTHVDNIGSCKTLEKLGFSYVETFNYDGYETPWRSGAEPTTWFKLSDTVLQ